MRVIDGRMTIELTVEGKTFTIFIDEPCWYVSVTDEKGASSRSYYYQNSAFEFKDDQIKCLTGHQEFEDELEEQPLEEELENPSDMVPNWWNATDPEYFEYLLEQEEEA